MTDEPTSSLSPADTDDADPIELAIAEVRADLDRRRAAGELPDLPPGELDRQFEAVAEATAAGLFDEPPLDVTDLLVQAGLDPYTSGPAPANPARRAKHIANDRLIALVGRLVQHQVGPFARSSAGLITALCWRQQQTATFLMKAHLGKVRSLEYRVAQLEEEIERLRAAGPD